MKKTIFTSLMLAVIVTGCGGWESTISGLTNADNAGEPPQDVIVGTTDTTVTVTDIAGIEQDVVSEDTAAKPRYSYVVVIADTHLEESDDGHANNARAIGEEISKLPWPIEAVFVLGDVIYQIPYTTLQEYIDDPADKFDIAQEIFDDYPVPVYPLIGNHDIDNGPDPWVELGEQLFDRHFGVPPYYSIDVGDFRFLLLSNFKGPTHVIDGPGYDFNSGSLGETQLEWMQEKVDEGRPTILMAHFPPFIIQDIDDFMRDNTDTVRLMLAGHSHGWLGLSDHYGVPSMVVGTCMYDHDSIMIMELDNKLHTWRMLNWDKVYWGTAYALPWDHEQD